MVKTMLIMDAMYDAMLRHVDFCWSLEPSKDLAQAFDRTCDCYGAGDETQAIGGSARDETELAGVARQDLLPHNALVQAAGPADAARLRGESWHKVLRLDMPEFSVPLMQCDKSRLRSQVHCKVTSSVPSGPGTYSYFFSTPLLNCMGIENRLIIC